MKCVDFIVAKIQNQGRNPFSIHRSFPVDSIVWKSAPTTISSSKKKIESNRASTQRFFGRRIERELVIGQAPKIHCVWRRVYFWTIYTRPDTHRRINLMRHPEYWMMNVVSCKWLLSQNENFSCNGNEIPNTRACWRITKKRSTTTLISPNRRKFTWKICTVTTQKVDGWRPHNAMTLHSFTRKFFVSSLYCRWDFLDPKTI